MTNVLYEKLCEIINVVYACIRQVCLYQTLHCYSTLFKKSVLPKMSMRLKVKNMQENWEGNAEIRIEILVHFLE